MAVATLKNNWACPNTGTEVTLEDYRNEMRDAEFSGDMSFSQFQNSMNEWQQKTYKNTKVQTTKISFNRTV